MNNAKPLWRRLLGLAGEPTPEQRLLSAAMTGRAEMARAALDAGADPDAVDREVSPGRTALEWAVAEGHEPIVAALLSRRAKARLETARLAIEGGDAKSLGRLLRAIPEEGWFRWELCRIAIDEAALRGWVEGVEAIMASAPDAELRACSESWRGIGAVWRLDSPPPIEFERLKALAEGEILRREARAKNEIGAGRRAPVRL